MRFAGCEFEELSLQLHVKGCPAELALKPLEVLLQLLLRAGETVGYFSDAPGQQECTCLPPS
jgi:hypothetical protein